MADRSHLLYITANNLNVAKWLAKCSEPFLAIKIRLGAYGYRLFYI